VRIVVGAMMKPNWALSALLPLAAGYFLSYLLRNFYGVVAGDIMQDLHIGADGLGQITSVYFLVFAGAQLPIGSLLDRFGPRRVQASLLTAAAAGAGLCWVTTSFGGALAGRALIGLGTAGSLMAALKAAAATFPRERLPTANGLLVMCGGLGALAATWPVEAALRLVNWRQLFGLFAVAAAVLALVTAMLAPGPPRGATPNASIGLRDIVTDPWFLRFAPLSACCFGTVLAIQGLWAGPWLSDVNGLSRAEIARALGYMAIILIIAGPLWGIATRWLQQRIGLLQIMIGAACLLITAELGIITDPLHLPLPEWCAFGFFGGMTVLSYTILAQHFPVASVGRANGALNTMHIGWSFVVQLGVGQVVALWPISRGHYPAAAYRAALLTAMLCQACALAWFVVPAAQAAWRARTAKAQANDIPLLRPASGLSSGEGDAA
jgi:MFS family permease